MLETLTYHDNGQVKAEKSIQPGEQETYLLKAPSNN
jgi:hypothetical protein